MESRESGVELVPGQDARSQEWRKLLPTGQQRPHSADANILPIPAPREVTDAAFLGILPAPERSSKSGMLVRQYRFPYPLASLSLWELGNRGP